jgi:GAF domain-containing protein
MAGFSGLAVMLQRSDKAEAVPRRSAELAALYLLTDRLHRAQSLLDIYEAALDAITSALQCDRASILLLDHAGVMRFAAWRGLSDCYRQGADGYSPWRPDEVDPRPIAVEDVDHAKLTDSLKASAKQECIRALSFIPLVSDGVLIGKFMTYYDAPKVFREDDINLALTIARQLGFSIVRSRAEKMLRHNEEWLRLATQSGKVGLWEWDIIANRVSWTDSVHQMHGVSRQEFNPTAEAWFSLFIPMIATA